MTMNDESRASVRDGGPAYPVKGGMCFYYPKDLEGQLEKIEEEISNKYEGMTLRDYFAAKADVPWNAVLDTLALRGEENPTLARMAEYRAQLKYIEADAMIQARGH